MGRSMKKAYIIFIIIMICSIGSGCSVSKVTFDKEGGTLTPTAEADETDSWEDGTLLMVNGAAVNYREVFLQLLAAKEKAELLYGEGIWDYRLDDEGNTYGDEIREQVLDEFINLKIVCGHAKDLDIQLSEEEVRNAQDYTAEYIEKIGDENLVKYSLSEGLINELYTDNIVALRVYESITLSVDTNISDDEARQVDLQYIIKNKFSTNDDDEQVMLSGSDLTNLRDSVETLLADSMQKSDFKTFAELNTDSTDGVEITAGYGELPKEVEDIAFSLQDGEFASVIETEDAFYIVKCISSFDEDATNARKEEIISERQEQLFNDTFAAWKQEAVVVVNNKLWDSLIVE